MGFNYPNLVSKMEERGVGRKDLADILGISYYAVCRRFCGLTEWKLCETICLCRYFEVPDAEWLFTRSDTITQKS